MLTLPPPLTSYVIKSQFTKKLQTGEDVIVIKNFKIMEAKQTKPENVKRRSRESDEGRIK